MKNEIGRQVARPAGNDGTLDVAASTPNFEACFPYLWEFLAKHRGSGQMASTGSLVLFVEARAYKLCLNDRPNQRSAFVTGSTFGKALAAAEAGIGSNTVHWRKKGYKPRSDSQRTFAQA